MGYARVAPAPSWRLSKRLTAERSESPTQFSTYSLGTVGGRGAQRTPAELVDVGFGPVSPPTPRSPKPGR